MTYPVFQKGGEWFFWDETWANSNGPFMSETQAQQELMWYCLIALGDHKSHCRVDRITSLCEWVHCPQNREGEPVKTGRTCPLIIDELE